MALRFRALYYNQDRRPVAGGEGSTWMEAKDKASRRLAAQLTAGTITGPFFLELSSSDNGGPMTPISSDTIPESSTETVRATPVVFSNIQRGERVKHASK